MHERVLQEGRFLLAKAWRRMVHSCLLWSYSMKAEKYDTESRKEYSEWSYIYVFKYEYNWNQSGSISLLAVWDLGYEGTHQVDSSLIHRHWFSAFCLKKEKRKKKVDFFSTAVGVGLEPVPRKFLGIVGQDPSDSKSSRLHVDIFRFCFIHLRYIL